MEEVISLKFRKVVSKPIDVVFYKYSLVFNLYLNIVDIKEGWAYFMFDNLININKLLFYETYNNYYYNGNNSYRRLDTLEFYRIIISLLFKYYNNFLYKLSRYLYILDLKNYNFMSFFNRYFNLDNWFWHFYVKFRFQLNTDHLFGRSLEYNFYDYIIDEKNKYAYKVRRIELAPFWFIFYKYIKLFIYLLLNKYYTQNFFVKWWLNFRLELNLFIKLIIFYYYLKYKLKIFYYNLNPWFKFIIKVNYNFIITDYRVRAYINKLNNISILSSIYIYILNLYIKILTYRSYLIFIINNKFKLFFNSNNFIIYQWYLNIIFMVNIYNYIIKFLWLINYSEFYQFIKIYLFKFDFNLNSIFNFRDFFLYKLYIKSIIQYYIDILFKIKNKLVYFKSNYYYYRKPQYLNKLDRKFKTTLSGSFLNVNTRRNYNSFYNLTFNTFFLKNLYNFNLNMYIYLWNFYDLKLDIKLLFSPLIFVKYNFDNYIILIYGLIYVIFLIFIYIFYKKFFDLFFFSKQLKQVNINSQYNWNLFIRKKIIKILGLYSNDKFLFYKYILKKNIKRKILKSYYYIFIDKCNKHFSNLLIFRAFQASLINSKYYKKLKNLINIDNNTLLDISKNYLFVNFPFVYNNKWLKSNKFINLFSFNTFSYKKANKKYYLFSNNYIYSNNMFYFLIFYWLFLIPLFFLEYVLYRYHLRGHVLKKRKLIIYLKIFLDNFKIYVKFVKIFGEQIFYHKLKSKYIVNYSNFHLYNKKRELRYDSFFKWDRYNNLYIKMSPLGSYYYWFSHINKLHYFICYYKYFFNSIYMSYYIKYFNFIFILLCFFIYKYYNISNNLFYKIKYIIFNSSKIKNLLNIIKLK